MSVDIFVVGGLRCDYDGRYYCEKCHWGTRSPIPARIIHHWDFTPRPVCQASLQVLALLAPRPLLHLQKLNPMLFTFVDELQEVKVSLAPTNIVPFPKYNLTQALMKTELLRN